MIKGKRPKLRIKISSREDDLRDLEAFSTDPVIMNKDLPEANVLLEPEVFSQIKLKMLPLQPEWVPSNPRPSFPVHLRGA